jgi:hypothetical protein
MSKGSISKKGIRNNEKEGGVYDNYGTSSNVVTKLGAEHTKSGGREGKIPKKLTSE